jgi:hypothetical protein
MLSDRAAREGKRFYARNAVNTTLPWRLGVLMRSFSPAAANSHYTIRIHPALTSFANEVCATLARLVAYVGTLALLGILGVHFWDLWEAAGGAAEPPVKASWSEASRSHPAFAVSSLDPSEKTETYIILRHPEGGRKDIFRWAGKDEKPIAELEIYRLGGEFDPSIPAAADLAARMIPAAAPELEPAGPRRQQVRHGHAAPAHQRGRRRAVMPWLHQAFRGTQSADFRLVLPGQWLAGAARGDRLLAEPPDAADLGKRTETRGNVRSRRASARQLCQCCTHDFGRLGDGGGKPRPARRLLIATARQDTGFHATFSLHAALLWPGVAQLT